MPWDGASAEIDFMLADDVIAGDTAVITRSGASIVTLTGAFSAKQVMGVTDTGMDVIGRDVTFTVRDGTTTLCRINDVATVNAGTAYRIRDLGESLPSGFRVLMLAGG